MDKFAFNLHVNVLYSFVSGKRQFSIQCTDCNFNLLKKSRTCTEIFEGLLIRAVIFYLIKPSRNYIKIKYVECSVNLNIFLRKYVL